MNDVCPTLCKEREHPRSIKRLTSLAALKRDRPRQLQEPRQRHPLASFRRLASFASFGSVSIDARFRSLLHYLPEGRVRGASAKPSRQH